jgi:hypothetical protein
MGFEARDEGHDSDIPHLSLRTPRPAPAQAG